jgi:Flp pilus assembly protein CpaB
LKPRVRTGIIIGAISLILIVLGVFWILRTFNPSSSQQVPTAEPELTVQIAFAVNDMIEGHIISAEDVQLTDLPVQFAPRDAVDNLDTIIGRILKTEIYAGQMVLSHNVADPTNKIFDIAYVLDDSHVLMALPATDLISRQSIVQRGDIVDILVSYQTDLTPIGETVVTTENTGETGAQQVTFTAFQRLGITAMVIDIINTDENTPASVASTQRQNVVVHAYLVALDPQDALVLKYLNDAGGIFDFVIRAPTSTGQFTLTPVTAKFIKELYGLELIP